MDLAHWTLGPPGASDTGQAFCSEMSGSSLWNLWRLPSAVLDLLPIT